MSCCTSETNGLFHLTSKHSYFSTSLSSKNLWTNLKFCPILSYQKKKKKLVANAVSFCTQLSLTNVLSLGRPLYSEGSLSEWSWKVGCGYIVLWCKPKSHCFPKTAQCAVRSDMCKTTPSTTFSIITFPIPTKLAAAEQQTRRWTWNSLMIAFKHL